MEVVAVVVVQAGYVTGHTEKMESTIVLVVQAGKEVEVVDMQTQVVGEADTM